MKQSTLVRILALLLSICLLVSCDRGEKPVDADTTTTSSDDGTTATSADDGTICDEDPNNEPLDFCTPRDLRVNLLSEPFGVDLGDLRFSWTMNASKRNAEQKAYRIVVADSADKMTAGDYLFDSEWVESAQSTGISLPALKDVLKDNSLYYWRVITRDADGGEDQYSEPQAFSTAVGNEWAATDGIWAGSSAAGNIELASKDWTDYVMDVEFQIDGVAMGFIFRAVDDTSFYMWQFKVDNEGALLSPHVYKNGKFVGSSAIAKIRIPAELSFGEGDTVRARIICEGHTVKTYLADANGEYVLIDERDMSAYGFTKGSVGLRTGKSEYGKLYALRLHNVSDGTVLYESDFAEGENPFAQCTASDGVLTVPKNLSAGDIIVLGKNSDSFVFLRTEFSLEDAQISKLDRALLSVTATSPEGTRQFVYNMYVNGTQVGVGPSRYGKTPAEEIVLYYNTYDVTGLLGKGENCLAAINYATSGWAFLSQLTLHYNDGSFEIISNSARDSEAWSSLPANAVFGISNSIGTHLYSAHANNIDASLYPRGFASVDFDDEDWNGVYVGDNVEDHMTLAPSQTDNVSRYVSEGTVTVEKLTGGDYVVDLGGEIVGGIRFTVTLPTATEIKVYYGEQLNSNGSVKYRMLTGNVYEETWKLVAGENIIETIDMLTYRYVQISGCPVEITPEMVRGLEIRAAFDDDASSFDSDSELLNDIYELSKRTVKMTTQDLYVDSQSRERLAYEGDLVINLLASYAFGDDYSIGRFSAEYLYTHRTWPIEYLLLTAVSAMDDYMATGDVASLEAYYSVLKNRTATSYLNRNVGLLNTDSMSSVLIDWPKSERDGYDTSVAYNTVLNAVAVLSYEKFAEIAEITGHGKDADEFATLARTVRCAMIERLYDAEVGAFADGLKKDGTLSSHYAQHATAYALACGIYTDQAMADALAATIEGQGEIRMSVYGAFFLLKGLYDTGNGNVANKLLLDDDTSKGAHTWAYMLYRMNATLTTESWNSTVKSNMTLSHPWGAAPAYAIMSGIFGIRPTTAGYSTFDVRFQTEGIGRASLTVPTIKGSITASFLEGDDAYTASVTVPANTQATVYLPAAEGAALTVNGSPAEGEYSNGFVSVTVGSGTWNFVVEN